MKKVKLILILTLTMILTGCNITEKKETTKSYIITSSTTTTELPVIEPVILYEFEVGGYYYISPENQTMPSRITFYDEVDREIDSLEFSVELIKIPEFTQKISLYNLTFEKAEFENQVYPTDKEIRDEEFGGEKPIFVLKEQLVSGRYYIRHRDYLEQVWTIDLYNNNKLIRTYHYGSGDSYVSGYMLWTDVDFDYARLYNCSLVYYKPLP